MKNIFINIRFRRSFAAKLSFYVLLFTIIIFLATFLFFYYFTSHTIRQATEDKASGQLNTARLQIENVFTNVSTVPDNILWAVVEKGVDPDSLYSLTRQIIEHNDHVFGTAVAFEPNYFPQKGYYFSPYSYRDSSRIGTLQLGTVEYDYFSMDWYRIPKQLNRPYWSEPYYDEGGGGMLMVTYSTPIHDVDRTFIGILTVDVSLGWLTDLLNSVRPYPSAYTILLGRDGTYIVHPDKGMILNETIFTVADRLGDETLKQVGHRMINGEKGMCEVRNTSLDENINSYIFYTPLPMAEWSLAIVIRKNDVFRELNATNRVVILLLIAGLLLLFVFCMFIVRRLTLPLSRFAQSAREIAMGNFSAPLPDIGSTGEMGELYSSFHFMQEQLARHIEELQETTSAKERIESELRIARDIQMGMVPKIFPPFPDREDVDLYASLTPAKEVGGDFYDFFIDQGRLFFAIGDVSGKGIPASLFMAVTRSLFRSVAASYGDPKKIVESMNASMAETNESNMFVTLFVGILDLHTGDMAYCNAGHNPPVIISPQGGAVFMNVRPNIPAGLFDTFAYQPQTIRIGHGTTLFFYTDGLTEAEDKSKTLYGEKRLIDLLRDTSSMEPRQINDTILASVHAHVGPAEQSDDLTILVIKFNGNEETTDY